MTSQLNKEKIASTARPAVTSWHVTLFSLIFLLISQFTYAAWYTAVMLTPGSLAEYLPHEVAATIPNIIGSASVSVVWILLIYFTLKNKRGALLASFGVAVLILALYPIDLAEKWFLPGFGDFLTVGVTILLLVASWMAYRSYPKNAITAT